MQFNIGALKGTTTDNLNWTAVDRKPDYPHDSRTLADFDQDLWDRTERRMAGAKHTVQEQSLSLSLSFYLSGYMMSSLHI